MLNFIFAVLVLSCVTMRSQETITQVEGVEENILRSECLAIAEAGNVYELLAQIKFDTKKVLSYLEKRDPRSKTERIEFLAERILQNSELVKSLAKNEWNTPVGESVISWHIDRATSIEVLEIYFQGKKRDDLLKNVHSNGTFVEYKSQATFLEYCQFNQTLLLVVRVKIPGKKSKFYNLYVNPEKEIST